MKKAYKIKKGLQAVGREVLLADGAWHSTPFYAVLEPRWKNDKTDFENKPTEIGKVRADYYTYIGPYDHNTLALSDDACLYADGVKYIFKKREAVKLQNEVLFYSGIVRRVWDEAYD